MIIGISRTSEFIYLEVYNDYDAWMDTLNEKMCVCMCTEQLEVSIWK